MDVISPTSGPELAPARDVVLNAGSGGRPDWQTDRRGAWVWHVREDWAFLLSSGAPDWTALDADPRASLVKANDGRQVWRVEVGGRLVYVKIARPGRSWARSRRYFFGSDARREYRIADYAARHQVQTVVPVALAEAPINGREPISILITAGLPTAQPLNELWLSLDPASPRTRHIKNQLIDCTARLIAHAHQCGFEHFDLHSGNVLIDRLPSGTYRALFVDLHNVRTGRPVDDKTVTRNLAQLNQWFRLHANLTDRIRFLNRYLYWRSALGQVSPYARTLELERRALLAQLARAATAHAQALYAKRDRRAMRTGRYFARLRLNDGWRAHVFLEAKHPVAGSRASQLVFTREQWQEWLRDPLAWVKVTDRRKLLKDSATATVCRIELPHPDGPVEAVCKRTTSKKWFKRLQYLVRPSRAMTTWRRANALLHRQIATARPLAVVERRRFGVVVDSLLITEYIAGAIDLDTVLTVTMREMSPQRQRWLKEQLTTGLISIVRLLIERGFGHRDFKAPNIIVQWNPESDETPRIVLVDLDGVRPRRGTPEAAARRMLMRLNVSLDHCRRVTRTDRLRFLKRYFSGLGQADGEWKRIWRELAEMSERKRRIRERNQERKFKKYGRF